MSMISQHILQLAVSKFQSRALYSQFWVHWAGCCVENMSIISATEAKLNKPELYSEFVSKPLKYLYWSRKGLKGFPSPNPTSSELTVKTGLEKKKNFYCLRRLSSSKRRSKPTTRVMADIGLVLRKQQSKLGEILSKRSHFSIFEIDCLLTLYRKSSEGAEIDKMDRTRFREFLHNAFDMTDDILLDRIFKYFDEDNDGFINREEWILGLSVFLKGEVF